MDKEEMMRVCRAMAMFRPSFIALIMNLTPEDLIFMETCFQRTVLVSYLSLSLSLLFRCSMSYFCVTIHPYTLVGNWENTIQQRH